MATNVYELKPRRSRLRLGRGGVVYLTATVLILAAAIYTQANLLFWAFGLMVGGLTVSLMVAALSLRHMGVRRVLPSHGVVDEPMMLRYQIINRSRIAVFGLMVYETWGKGHRGWKKTGPASRKVGRLGGRPFGWLLHLGPHQTLQAEATCWPRQRGALHFERIVIDSGFPFGVIHKIVEFESSGEVLVYPRLWRINRRLLFALSHADSSGNRQVDRGGGHEDFFGLRPYRIGDRTKLIDWRRTASSGELVSRELTHPSPPRVMILLDLHPADVRTDPIAFRRQSERAISLTASLICDAYLNGYLIGLEIVGARSDQFTMHHSLPHRTRMIDALARLDVAALNRDRPISDQPSVIIRPGKTDEHLLAPQTGINPRTIVLGAEDLEQYVLKDATSSTELLRRSPISDTRRKHVASMRGAMR